MQGGRIAAGTWTLVLVASGILLTWVEPAQGAGAFQAATSANSAGAAATSLTLSVPAGTAQYDQLLAQVDVNGGSAVTITPPAGGTWTLVGTVSSGGSALDLVQAVYRRTAGAAEPASYTWTFTSGAAAGAMLRYSGIDPDIPIDATASAFTSATGTNPTAPASTASYASETAVRFVGRSAAVTFTPAASTTERSDSGAFTPGTESADETVAASGAVAARTPTASSTVPTASVVGQTVVLRSATLVKLRGVTLPATTAPATSVALTPPAGTTQRDLMVAQVVADSAAAVTAPAGWTEAVNTPSAGVSSSDIRQVIYYKVAGATETSAYTWSTTNKKLDGALFVYAGVDDANPLDGTASGLAAASSTTATAPAITTAKANGLLLAFFACGAGSCDPFTTPAGMNERVDTGQTPVVSMAAGDFAFAAADKPLGAAGAQAANAATVSGSALVTIGATIALRPAEAAFTAAASNVFEAAGSATLNVALSGATSTPVTVAYAVTGGTATGGGVDYTLASGTLSFAPGTTSASITVTIVDDANPDGGATALDETVVVTLSSPHDANLGATATHTLTIKDDEPKVAASVVSGAGATLSVAWGGWSAVAGASSVQSTNYLRVADTDPDPAGRPAVTIDFTPSAFTGVTDAAQTIALDGNLQFSCVEDATGTAAPSSLTFPAFGAASPTGSVTRTFTADGAVLYCRSQVVAIPVPTLDQDYQAAFTVVAA